MCKLKVFLVIVILALAARIQAADNLVLVTIDGLRWQGVFSGYDPALMDSEQFTEHREVLLEQFGANTPETRRQTLMPFTLVLPRSFFSKARRSSHTAASASAMTKTAPLVVRIKKTT